MHAQCSSCVGSVHQVGDMFWHACFTLGKFITYNMYWVHFTLCILSTVAS